MPEEKTTKKRKISVSDVVDTGDEFNTKRGTKEIVEKAELVDPERELNKSENHGNQTDNSTNSKGKTISARLSIKRRRNDDEENKQKTESSSNRADVSTSSERKNISSDASPERKVDNEEKEKVKPGSSSANQADTSSGVEDKNGSTAPSLKRKREREVDDEEEEKGKYIKTDETLQELKEFKDDLPVPTIKRRRISKNECICSPVETKPVRKTEDVDAHIQVEEWRLHKFQSPIELKHDESIHHDHFDPLEFHGHWDATGEATLSNNGFTATLKFYDKELPLLQGGPLHEDKYTFEQLHFHWSEDDHSGCEHIFEGRAYSMEAHAVHFNKKYKNFQTAKDKPDGLAVVAFFIQATDNEDNPCFNKMSKAVQDIIKINTTTKVPTDCLTWFKEEAQCKGYYTYQGSLTTEPYLESVTWIIYPQPIHVSREQVASFRRLHSTPCEKHNIKQNVRPIQTPPEHKKLNVFYARSHRHSNSD